jgi:hypothetical protein
MQLRNVKLSNMKIVALGGCFDVSDFFYIHYQIVGEDECEMQNVKGQEMK